MFVRKREGKKHTGVVLISNTFSHFFLFYCNPLPVEKLPLPVARKAAFYLECKGENITHSHPLLMQSSDLSGLGCCPIKRRLNFPLRWTVVVLSVHPAASATAASRCIQSLLKEVVSTDRADWPRCSRACN